MTILANLALVLLWIGASIALVLLTAHATRRLMPPPPGFNDPDGNVYPLVTRDIASTAGFRIAALYGIILALVYAQELHDYQDVRAGLSTEAVALSQLHADANRYGGTVAAPVTADVAAYVRMVVDEEWDQLSAERSLSDAAWNRLGAALETVLDAETRNARETTLRARMLASIEQITALRLLREEQAADNFAWVFWLPAVAGLVLVSMPFFAYPPTRETRILLATFGAFAGLILFFIDAFSNPFDEPFRVPPSAFERLLETSVGKPALAGARP